MATSGCHTSDLFCFFVAFILISCPRNVFGWDNDDLELFDLVEEVNANFYEVLEVSKSAPSSEIKKAYRKKTLLLHPDKNEAEDAEEQFRKLVAVYEVLKDENKREKYDAVLENGLPDWRQPVFYYRKARKLGLLESALILGLVMTIGQYFVLWASYLEKRLTLESFFQSKMKREKRGKKAAAINEQIETDMQEGLDAIPMPKLRNLWPVSIVKLVLSIPARYRVMQAVRQFEKEQREREKAEEEQRQLDIIRQKEEIEQKKLRKKNRVVEVENTHVKEVDVTPVFYGAAKQCETESEDESTKCTQVTGEWTDEDYVNLSKAYLKFPGGTTNRWEKIADMMGRPVNEVTKKCKEMKGNMQMNLNSSVQGGTKNSKKAIEIKDEIISTADSDNLLNETSDSSNKLRKRNKPAKDSIRTLMISEAGEPVLSSSSQQSESLVTNCIHDGSQGTSQGHVTNSSANQSVNQTGSEAGKLVIKKSVNKTEPKIGSSDKSKVPKGTEADAKKADGENWSQNQQVILEWALKQYPKGTEQRWEKIADQIPDKTKEDCIARFKLLAELVKQKKQSTQS